MKTEEINAKELRYEVQTYGKILPTEKVDISSRIRSYITKIYVKEGDVVKKGQILVSLNPSSLQLDLKKMQAKKESMKASLALSTAKYEKAKKLAEIKLLEIDNKLVHLKEVKVELDKTKGTYLAKTRLLNAGGVSREEHATVKLLLASIEAKYILAKNDLEMAKIGYRKKDLQTENKNIEDFIRLNTESEKAEVELAKANLKMTEIECLAIIDLLKDAEILSPIEAVVESINKNVGELHEGSGNAGRSAILNLLGIQEVYASVPVREADLKEFGKEAELVFSLDAYPGKTFSSDLSIINPVVDPKNHSYEVKALIKNSKLELRPGMFLRARLISKQKSAKILIPQSALIPSSDKRFYVYLIKHKTAYKQFVTKGKEYGNSIEIIEGLKPKDLIAIDNLSELSEGIEIE
ncbi:MAG: efflux RND transporter periplasmic adaptor subunit [Leptospiraceae bacterium]|nr:efflux RND transporter periplasmic adaptor subunit [Leptospiraceae bacterium]